MIRAVSPEALDGLAADDPEALRSRRDLRRIHVAMGNCGIVAQGLRTCGLWRADKVPLRVLELGAGDGSLMLRVARTLAPDWPRIELTLLDRQALVTPSTVEGYAQLGWTASLRVQDVQQWAGGAPERWDVIVATLFLHHFEGEALSTLLAAVAASTGWFFACEPRRGWMALAGSHLVGALGANAVTREDAVLSVRAGFAGTELSALWPAGSTDWRLREYRSGMFSHCFAAQRTMVLR